MMSKSTFECEIQESIAINTIIIIKLQTASKHEEEAHRFSSILTKNVEAGKSLNI